MKVTPPVRLILGAALLVLVCCPLTRACSCVEPQNLTMLDLVRRSVDTADTVFVGVPRVLHGKENTQDEDLVVFDVETVFKGAKFKQIGIHSGSGLTYGSSCGYSFEIGTRYLVLADRFGDYPHLQLAVQECSGFTAPIDKTGVALRYLRKEALLPEDFFTPLEIRRRANGRIYGSIRRSDGKPLGSDVTVYIWDDSNSSNEVWSDSNEMKARLTVLVKDGQFDYGFIPPGSYRVAAVDESFSAARWVGYFGPGNDSSVGKIEIKAGQDFRDAEIVLHEQKEYSIRGTVRSADGTSFPFEDTEIFAKMAPDEQFPYLNYIEVDSEGRFFIPGIPSGKVRLKTYVSEYADPNWETSVTELEVTGSVANLEIILNKKASATPPLFRTGR